MANYHPNKLALVGQGIARHRNWVYADTGSTLEDMDAAGYFTDAGDKGAEVGDTIDCRDLTVGNNAKGRFTVVQDTGATQGTIVLDTG
jgi:hypothetical protein